jgi:hypothetical protein
LSATNIARLTDEWESERPDGTKELITVEDGYRESAESWKDGAPRPQTSGMRPPVVAVGEVRSASGPPCGTCGRRPEQRDWFHKLGNILYRLPKWLQPRVKAALHEVMYAETRDQAREAIPRFSGEYGAKYRLSQLSAVRSRVPSND